LEKSGRTGFVPYLNVLLRGTYYEHDWEPEDGQTNPETLKEIGLEFTAAVLP
jgi:hypothetical protein